MNHGHPGYLLLLDEMRDLHVKKAADYGGKSDPLANCRASTELGVPAWVGTMVRALDKVTRIKSFIANGKLENESVEDSLKDLAAYALIALVLFREQHAADSPRQTAVAIATGSRVRSFCGICHQEDGHIPSRPGFVANGNERERRKRVYVAGPITVGHLESNVSAACEAGMELLKSGLAPLVPHLTCYLGQALYTTWAGTILARAERLPQGTRHEDWIAADLPWVAVADAVLRLPGESKGADAELAEALRLGKPIFRTVADVLEWAKSS